MEEVVKKDIPKLSPPVRKQIKKAIDTRLVRDPVAYGKPLRFGLAGQRRLRVGDYRIIYTIDHEQHLVTINTIKHRKEVYG
ncbi:type II toxin-antitoxin system RelE family toxin [Seonamhaeicola marinus]|nr:type II toxin-antitoxin system RelE/ParE family toxin [Seonamhaeicola marinus]